MRHFSSAAIAAVYFLLSAGLTVMVHTCGGATTYDLMPASAADPCGCADEPAADRCCTLEFKTFEVDADQKPAPVSTAGWAFVADFLSPGVLTMGSVWRSPVRRAVQSPPPSSLPIPILNCSLLV